MYRSGVVKKVKCSNCLNKINVWRKISAAVRCPTHPQKQKGKKYYCLTCCQRLQKTILPCTNDKHDLCQAYITGQYMICCPRCQQVMSPHQKAHDDDRLHNAAKAKIGDPLRTCKTCGENFNPHESIGCPYCQEYSDEDFDEYVDDNSSSC